MRGVHRERSGRGQFARVVAGLLLLVVSASALAAIAIALGLGQRDPLDLDIEGVAFEARAKAAPQRDPFAWDPSRASWLERRAALGASHVIYEMSPGGVIASAERTAAFRDQIEEAAARHDVDPDVLEAMIFLESAGRPDVSAGETPEAASGLAQITPSAAIDLLGMEVDLAASVELTKRIAKSKTPERAERLRAKRAAIDERFDPEAALEGAATYLEIARERFGSDELAVESYHMGIGNLESVIRAYLRVGDGDSIGDLVAAEELTFAQLYFDSSPSRHADAYELLSGLGDESADYLWKVRASEEMMFRFREDSEGLEETAELATAKASLEEVFHPESETEVFEDPDAITDAIDGAELAVLPSNRALGWVPDKDIGELAAEVDEDADLYRALRPEAVATLSYMGGLVRNLSGTKAPLRVTSAVRDREYQDLLTEMNPEATDEYSLHTTGWAFDILRDYESREQAAAFQFVLDRLSSIALIDYAIEPGAIHVTASDLGERLVAGD